MRVLEGFMSNLINRFVADERGATAIEYGLIASLVCVAIIAAVTSLGTNTGLMWGRVSSNMK
jgi:pilus assembly protein Flp/PilA